MIEELNVEDFDDFVTLAEKVSEVHAQLFPDATLESQIKKFEEEFEEVEHAAKVLMSDEETKNELADLYIVACGIKRFSEPLFAILQAGLVKDIPDRQEYAEAIIAKMNKNIKRKWDNKNGLYKHTTLN